MNEIENIIGKDCCNIIREYKKDMEDFEENISKIENCLETKLNYQIFEVLYDDLYYGNKYTKLYHKFYLIDFTIKNLQDFFIDKGLLEIKIMVIFTVNTPEYIDFSEDYIQLDILKLNNDFLLRQNIEYIYKNRGNSFCIHLGTYKEDRLNTLYESIKGNYIDDFYIFFN